MPERIKWLFREDQFSGMEKTPLPQWLNSEAVKNVHAYHKKMPGYQLTPLVSLDDTARSLGIHKLWVKDESRRLGLNAFKVLGASWAIGRILAQKAGCPVEELSWQNLRDIAMNVSEPITFVTATDGNHGRAVAWAAQQLGCRAVVYMPKGSAAHRLNAILDTGAHGEITDMNYDDAVRLAASMAEKNSWILVQDTAWEGYMEIPQWIMEGYSTLAEEIDHQLTSQSAELPTHVILQAGVGSFAGGVLGAMASRWGERLPRAIIAEPEAAACIYESAKAKDGKLRVVGGDLSTIMAGLACGEPNPTAWPILRDYAFSWASCHDSVAACGMQRLARPQGEDPSVVSGESGAVGMGIVAALCGGNSSVIAERLGIGPDSRILIISTEGDTDPVNYQQIVNSQGPWGLSEICER